MKTDGRSYILKNQDSHCQRSQRQLSGLKEARSPFVVMEASGRSHIVTNVPVTKAVGPVARRHVNSHWCSSVKLFFSPVVVFVCLFFYKRDRMGYF